MLELVKLKSTLEVIMYRLFVAVDLPESVKASLQTLCRGVSGAKWVTNAQMHVTLRFIGAADSDLYERIKSSLNSVACRPFDLQTCNVGCFPAVRNARVLWAGLRHDGTMDILKQRIDAALLREGLEPEERPFSPHITLARMKVPDRPAVTGFLSSHESFSCPAFRVTEFHLFSSTLSPKGPTYAKEKTYSLTATAD